MCGVQKLKILVEQLNVTCSLELGNKSQGQMTHLVGINSANLPLPDVEPGFDSRSRRCMSI